MTSILKTVVATAPSPAIEAENHSKNSAMKADTKKHGRSSKSQMRKFFGYKFVRLENYASMGLLVRIK